MVFALQMLNFPILGGTSGHLLGFVLMAILVTPTSAFLMISVILILQAFIFFDGGILALSANIFNMGIVTIVGYFIYWVIHRSISSKFKEDQNKLDKGLLIGTFIGAYSSIIFASLIAGIEIGISQNFPYGMDVTIPTMLIYHAFIGIGEALITMVILGFFNKFANNYIPNIMDIPLWR
jgi:cobalt/nickel transport system permease protein